MDQILRLLLPIYFIIYFGLAFVLKSLIVARKIGKNPLVLPKDDSAFGLIGRYFKLTLIAMFIYVLAFAFLPTEHHLFLPITALENFAIKYIGLALLAIALIWTIIAQRHMKNSWRVGLFLTTPNAFTGLFLILGYILIQIQIRLEEEFLTKEHSQNYIAYMQKVRRLI